MLSAKRFALRSCAVPVVACAKSAINRSLVALTLFPAPAAASAATCRGGVVKFINNDAGSAHTINYAGGPSTFPSIPLGAINGATAQTPALNNPGQTNFLFSGFALQGQIHAH